MKIIIQTHCLIKTIEIEFFTSGFKVYASHKSSYYSYPQKNKETSVVSPTEIEEPANNPSNNNISKFFFHKERQQ